MLRTISIHQNKQGHDKPYLIKNRRLQIDYSFKNGYLNVSITCVPLLFKSKDKQEYFTVSLESDIE